MKVFKSGSTVDHQRGFSLVEVMVAAVVMMSLMLGTNRMITLGMASSSGSSTRYMIEQEILGDIEDIQNIDTRLNNSPDCSSSQSSSVTLFNAIINELGDSDSTQTKQENGISAQEEENWTRSLNTENPDLLVVTYIFYPNGLNRESELRVVEITPSFRTACPLIS